MTLPKWDEERTNALLTKVGEERPVSRETLDRVAEELGTTVRSVGAKLRKLNIEVSPVGVAAPKFSPEEEQSLREFVESNPKAYTYAEIASVWNGGSHTTKQVQGKLLSMELTSMVKPTEKQEVARTYTPEEEQTFISLANAGAFIEDIATALGKEISSIRGKALSLLRNGDLTSIPTQKESHAKEKVDALDNLGNVSKLSVAEIAEKINKTERGVRVMLTRRGISCADHDGAAKKAKAEAERKAA